MNKCYNYILLIVSTEGTNCNLLIGYFVTSTQEHADSFYNTFNGQTFNSLEEEVQNFTFSDNCK